MISVSPSEHGYEGVFVIRAGAGGVRLYFNSGKGLPDPEKLLEGSGKRARWMAVEGASTLSRPAEARLVEEAVARSPVAFARSGGGTVLVRSTTAKRAREGGSAARGAGPRKKSG
ncbi:MAG: hypothetical protein JNM07_14330 [Phycisphaerae bacterium]|nr:hypothetical protein [Phycisphaerae bacterium]